MLDLAAIAEDYIVFITVRNVVLPLPTMLIFKLAIKVFLLNKNGGIRKPKDCHLQDSVSFCIWMMLPRIHSGYRTGNRRFAIALFNFVYNAMELKPGEDGTPWWTFLHGQKTANGLFAFFHALSTVRLSCHAAAGDANILISPASVDMGGVFITPQEKDFEKANGNRHYVYTRRSLSDTGDEFRKLRQRIKEQLWKSPKYMRRHPVRNKNRIIFPDTYRVNEKEVSGKTTCPFDNGKILWKTTVTMNCCLNLCGKRLTLSELLDVTIGINSIGNAREPTFSREHWNHCRRKITGINVIHVEASII